MKQSRKSATQFDEESTPCSKRKRIVLDLAQKDEIIKKIELGYSREQIAEDYNIGVSTVYQICRIQADAVASNRFENINSPLRKVFKSSDFPLVDHALKTWYNQERSKNTTLAMPILAHKAKDFYNMFKERKIDMKPFKGSLGYIQKFLSRYNLSNEKTLTEDFVRSFQSLAKDYSYEQIYNADEFGLDYCSLPNSKLDKERVTLMVCANATGDHKLPLVFIHKHANPKSLKSTMPVYYSWSKNAWMDQTIFENWFHYEFVPKVRKNLIEKNLEPKALLLIDNCPVHPVDLKSSDGKIECVFFPTNCASSIQPMNQGPFSLLKRKYKVNLLSLLLKTRESLIEDALKKIEIKHVIDLLANLWDQLPIEQLESSWHKLNLHTKIPPLPQEIDMSVTRSILGDFGLVFSDECLKDWLNSDINDPGFQILNDNEIVDKAIKLLNEKEPTEPSVSNTTALMMCDDLVKYCKRHNIDVNSSLSTIRSAVTQNKDKNIK